MNDGWNRPSRGKGICHSNCRTSIVIVLDGQQQIERGSGTEQVANATNRW
jgi:hypothetical protein